MTAHQWKTSERHSWTKLGARVTTYVCDRCGVLHGGPPHPGRCGDGCGNYYPSHGRVPACDPTRLEAHP